jgi:starch phosphorylase
VILLDTDLPENDPEDRTITHFLYAASLYEKLEHTVLPLFYGRTADRTDGWIRLMKGAIAKNAAYFNSHRMMRRYATEAYLR